MTLILFLILLVLVFGAGWLRGVFQGIAFIVALVVVSVIIERVTGIDGITFIMWAGGGFLVVGGIIVGFFDALVKKSERDWPDRLAEINRQGHQIWLEAQRTAAASKLAESDDQVDPTIDKAG